MNCKSYLFFILLPVIAFSQNPSGKRIITIKNDVLERKIVLDNGEFSTQSFRLKSHPYNFVSIIDKEPESEFGAVNSKYTWYRGANPEEFSFLLNGEKVNGSTGWEIVSTEETGSDEAATNNIVLKGIASINRDIQVTVSYVVYPHLAVVRKNIELKNTGSGDISVESFDVECLNVPWGNIHNVVYRDYARYKHIGPYVGNWNDPLIISHDADFHHGIIVGNEAPGVLKRISVCTDGRSLTAGLTHVDQDYAFRKTLKPEEEWESPWVFTGLYTNKNPNLAVEKLVGDFVRKYMGIRLAEIPSRPTFVYNTWHPFRREVNEELIMELADAAAASGVEEFIIDDGWQVGFGDWEIDYTKFPNGLKPVFDHIKAKGMKPGLWLSMGAASSDSKVFKEHPEWFVKYRDGNFVNLHSEHEQGRYSACFTTGWKDYIRDKILGLVKEHGLEYVKLDFAIAASAYRFDPDVSGCFADNHPHADRQESYLEIYRRAWLLFDELHEAAPNLFIDCTFETMGELQLIDFDMCKHAEGNWLSNFEGQAPDGSLRIRQMSWWRSGAIPATALVIGNQSLEDEDALYSFKSLAGSLPIMLGDVRQMSKEKQQQFKAFSTWLRSMENKHQIMLFRQDLPGFGEPAHGSWDGFQRINTETKSGGIVGVFRQYSGTGEQWVRVNYLDDDTEYVAVLAPKGEVVAKSTGREFRETGFKVVFQNEFQGELYEIKQAN
jgi:alpha-galactosidase